ncbi:hypothetical protein TNIN_198471 [Trichonephila inaurata madagascariensis]|uniref:Uncharacterized protein n=1 Tax=Trichonephila inaurata madagascariensis TaxID=2747483 RepID=A0A8X6XC50_9ARAC|nr:hypothetical protein TNIN_198471 [Trichonephila inaurata madagascariensis]
MASRLTYSKQRFFQVSGRSGDSLYLYLRKVGRGVLVVATVYRYRMTSLPSFHSGFSHFECVFRFPDFENTRISSAKLNLRLPRRKRTKIGRSPRKTKGLLDDDALF